MEMTKAQLKEIRDELEKNGKRRVLDYIQISIGSFIYAVSIALFLDPNAMAPGGVTGLCVILNRMIPIETGTLILIMNIPIMILGIWKFGFRFILSTLYCLSLSSMFINILSPYGPLTDDLFLAAIAGGSVMGVGLGIIFKTGATNGGVDIIIKILRRKMPHLKTGSLYMVLDTVVVILSAIVFKNIEVAMYAGIVVLIDAWVMDVVLYGRDGAKMIFIISDRHEAIANRLMEDLDIGVTYISGSGAYSGKDKKVILCVMKKTLSPKVEEIVRQEDPSVFMIVSSATEIFGEGYKSIFSEKI